MILKALTGTTDVSSHVLIKVEPLNHEATQVAIHIEGLTETGSTISALLGMNPKQVPV